MDVDDHLKLFSLYMENLPTHRKQQLSFDLPVLINNSEEWTSEPLLVQNPLTSDQIDTKVHSIK